MITWSSRRPSRSGLTSPIRLVDRIATRTTTTWSLYGSKKTAIRRTVRARRSFGTGVKSREAEPNGPPPIPRPRPRPPPLPPPVAPPVAVRVCPRGNPIVSTLPRNRWVVGAAASFATRPPNKKPPEVDVTRDHQGGPHARAVNARRKLPRSQTRPIEVDVTREHQVGGRDPAPRAVESRISSDQYCRLMRCQARRWAHSMDPRHEVEQRGYDLIGAMLKHRRLRAKLTQRELERLTRIDQTVISRLENGRQYGLRWSRFAILVATLDGLDDATAAPPPPWWIRMGITPPPAMLEQLRQ